MWSVPRAASDASACALTVSARRLARAVLHAHLGGHDDVVAVAALGHPGAHDLLRLAARVQVGGVDEVAAGGRVGVQHGERLVAVGGPAEHVAAQAERVHVEVGVGDRRHGLDVRPQLHCDVSGGRGGHRDEGAAPPAGRDRRGRAQARGGGHAGRGGRRGRAPRREGRVPQAEARGARRGRARGRRARTPRTNPSAPRRTRGSSRRRRSGPCAPAGACAAARSCPAARAASAARPRS